VSPGIAGAANEPGSAGAYGREISPLHNQEGIALQQQHSQSENPAIIPPQAQQFFNNI